MYVAYLYFYENCNWLINISAHSLNFWGNSARNKVVSGNVRPVAVIISG